MAPNQSSPEEMIARAHALLEQREYAAAIEIAQGILELNPHHAGALSLIRQARRKEEDGKLEQELAAHNKALQQQAEEHFQTGEFEKCLGIYNFLCELDPQNVHFRAQLGLCQGKLGHRQGDAGQPLNPPLSSLAEQGAGEIEEAATANEPAIPSSATAAEEVLGAQPPGRSLGRSAAAGMAVLSSLPWNLILKIGGAVSLLVFGIILAKVVISGLYVQPVESSFATLVVYSTPEGASVWINGNPRGQTYLSIDPILPGNYEIRLEKEGYTPLVRHISINKGESANLSVQLEKRSETSSSGPLMSEAQLLERARRNFDQEQWAEAWQDGALLLSKNPASQEAQKLRQDLQVRVMVNARSAVQGKRWEEAQKNLELALRMNPQDQEAKRLLRRVQEETRNSNRQAAARSARDVRRLQVLHRQLESEIAKGNLFPPPPQNAMDLLRQVEGLAPGDPYVVEKSAQIRQTARNQIGAALRARNFVLARNLLRSAGVHYRQDVQLAELGKQVEAEETRRQQDENALLARAEAALAASRFLLPAQDSVVGYCSQILFGNPQNQRALQLKREAYTRAFAQARQLAQGSRFDEARQLLVQLEQAARKESEFPLSEKQISEELGRLQFTAFQVAHEHTLVGDCRGVLNINHYVISYEPAGASRDGFTCRLPEIVSLQGGDKVKIQFQGKNYRFSPNPAGSKEENRRRCDDIVQIIQLRLPNQ